MTEIHTPEDVKNDFETLIDDTLDEDYTYSLMTEAMHEIDALVKPVFLEKVNSSAIANPGDTYTTMKALPTDYLAMRSLLLDTTPYFPVPLAAARAYKDTARKYYIDFNAFIQGNSALGICGAIGSAKTIYQNYIMRQPALTTLNKASATAILWPDHWKKILKYKMAEIARSVDPDEVNYKFSAEDRANYTRLLAMIEFENTSHRADQMGGEIGYDDDEPEVDIGMM